MWIPRMAKACAVPLAGAAPAPKCFAYPAFTADVPDPGRRLPTDDPLWRVLPKIAEGGHNRCASLPVPLFLAQGHHRPRFSFRCTPQGASAILLDALGTEGLFRLWNLPASACFASPSPSPPVSGTQFQSAYTARANTNVPGDLQNVRLPRGPRAEFSLQPPRQAEPFGQNGNRIQPATPRV